MYSLYHVPRCAAPGLRSAGGCGPDPLSTSSSSALAALNALGANDHDALFYVDADRGYISGQNGQTQVQRWGVVGLVFIDSLDQAGAAAVFDGATSSLRAAVPQTRDGVEVSLFEAQPEPGRDVVLLDGLVDPRGVTFDTATGCVFAFAFIILDFNFLCWSDIYLLPRSMERLCASMSWVLLRTITARG